MDVVKLPANVTETAAAAPPSWAARRVSGWALISACSIVFDRAVDYLLYFYIHCDPDPSSVFLRCVNLTDAEAAEETVLWKGILCCAALQAAAAVLALRLPSRRSWLRHCLEFVALAAAILDHCMYATVVCLVLTADPEYLFYKISRTAFISFLAVGDILGSIALILEECVEMRTEEQARPAGRSYLVLAAHHRLATGSLQASSMCPCHGSSAHEDRR